MGDHEKNSNTPEFGDGVVSARRRAYFSAKMVGMAIRLIALDIDGTLLNSKWKVSAVNCAAIAEATRRGIEVALVTGRRYDFALPVARQIGSPLTMIVNNGALVRTNDGQTHIRHLLPRETALRVLDATRKWREGTAVVFDRPLAKQVILERINWDDLERVPYYTRNREFLAEAQPLESCLDEDPIQVMFTGRVDPMKEAESLLRSVQFQREFALAVTLYADKDFGMIDLIHPKVTKGATLSEWAAHWSIAREEILAIGDNYNDLEMLSFAGVPVVMENAVAELKTRGWHITRSNDEDGVAAAIELFAFTESLSALKDASDHD
jgi:Cof subfamily protein (haloacid dehalogenase superfamily)